MQKEDLQAEILLKQKEIEGLTKVGNNYRRRISECGDKVQLFSTKDKTERSRSNKFANRDSNFMERDEGSDLGKAKGHSKSFILSSTKKQSELNEEKTSEDQFIKPRFFISPDRLRSKHEESRDVNDKREVPLNRLQKARLLSHRCKSFLDNPQHDKGTKNTKSIEIIPQGLRDYLYQLKTGPLENRASALNEDRDSNIPNERQDRDSDSDFRIFSHKHANSFRQEIERKTEADRTEKQNIQESKSSQRKKLNCARKLTFEEVSPPAPNAQLKVEEDRASLIVTLSEELLKRRKSTKVKPTSNPHREIRTTGSPRGSKPPLSLSTNVNQTNCFLMGAASKNAVKKRPSIDLQESNPRNNQSQKVSHLQILQESLKMASNPFRALCSPSKYNTFSNR